MATVVVATAYGDPEVLSVIDREVAAPGPGEVTIAVRASGVNPIDFKLYSGAFGTEQEKLPLPVGLELAGVVTATGEGAEGPGGTISVGDEVAAFSVPGAAASEITVPASVVVPKPADVSFEVASAALLAGGTAVHALAVSGIKPGETLLVHGGSGAVGVAAVQLAVADGITVLATGSAGNQELLRSLGAIPVEYGAGLLDRVRAAAPDGVDAVVDAVGTDEAIDASLELVAEPRRIVSAVAFGRADTGITLIGGGPGADPGTDIRANAWRQLFPAIEAGTLRVPIARTYPLAQTADAHRLVATGHAGGKVVLLP
ncbi:MAG TPA: NADP-dependent oxidoreductase [Pseudonocardia sp.]|jgi:NADPH:quinone reductase-like Zn-dependent oxidoreductase|nr:NADP-dependent oxidoreductase [Pseudonocardia sp.]